MLAMNISEIGLLKFVSNMRAVALGLCAVTFAGCAPQPMAGTVEKPVLGYMLDISRDKVPTMQSLYRMVDILAMLGYDQFQLYSEHTFAYKDHEQVWNDSSPLTAAEIRALDDYCAKKGIALVPNQNSFGHLEKWFRRPAYRPLAEAPEGGVRTPWGSTMVVPRALCPTDPKSLEFVDSLYAELLPNFRSDLLNVGCDEVWELQSAGKGRSWAAVQKAGEARVWLDYFKKVCALAAKHGKTALFWDDMVARSHPELLGEIPANAIALDWGYEIGTKHNYDRECGRLRDAGVRFYVCPGSSGWNAISGRHDNMKANVEEAVSAGLKYGAIGYLMTDWGNGGHCQPWITALPSLIYMAERVKGVSLTDEELAARVDKLVGCRCGKALLRYQNLYLKSGAQKTNNASPLYKMLSGGKAYRRPKWMTDDCLKAVFAEWRAAQKDLDLTGAPDWVTDGFATMDLLYSALELRWKGEHERVRKECPAPFRALWLKYNRPGGLDDSVQQNFHGDKVTEVVFSFDTEDFTSPRDAEGILELAKMFTEEGVVAHFQTVGFLAQQLVKWGRQDVIAAMKKHYICCHTLRHSVHPNILELSEGEDYAAAYKRVYDQEKACLDILKDVFGVDRVWSSCPPGNSEPYVANRVYADLGIKFDLGASFLPNEGPDI